MSVALPLLEAMTPARSMAAGMTGPTRAAFVYIPNAVHMPAWTPATTGSGFELPPILAPLKPSATTFWS